MRTLKWDTINFFKPRMTSLNVNPTSTSRNLKDKDNKILPR